MAVWVQFSKSCISLKITDGRLGTTFEILYFAIKNRTAVWAQLSNFVFRLKKTNSRLGTRIIFL